MDLIIKEKFRSLIPPLTIEEREQLEASIKQEGCREAITTWAGVIVDGHNRYDICRRHNIPFTTNPKTFCDEDAAVIWIIRNQFGRRNISLFSKCELALKLEAVIAAKAKANQQLSKGRGQKGPQISADLNNPRETREKVAKLAGVSHDTTSKVKLIMEHADEDTKNKLRMGEAKINTVAKEVKSKMPVASLGRKRPGHKPRTIADGKVSRMAVRAAFAAIKTLNETLQSIGVATSVKRHVDAIYKELEHVRETIK